MSKKHELAKRLATKVEMSIKDTDGLLDDVFDSIEETLIETGEVTLGKLGKIKTVERAARKARNPKTGEEIDVAAKTAAKFSPSKQLKDKLNA